MKLLLVLTAVSRFSVLEATESWAGPGNETMTSMTWHERTVQQSENAS